MTGRHTGRVLEVSDETLGSLLAEDTTAGSTQLLIDDASDFDEDGGWLSVNGQPVAYTAVAFATNPDDPDTLTLADMLEEDAEEGDEVAVWSPLRAAPEVVRTAQVQVDGTDDLGDPLDVYVPVYLAPYLPTGIRGDVGESVDLDLDGDEWRVVDVLGLVPSDSTGGTDTGGASGARWMDEDFDAAGGAQSFSLSYVPVDLSEDVKVNGLGQLRNTDWSQSNGVLTVADGVTRAGDVVTAHYQYVGDRLNLPPVTDPEPIVEIPATTLSAYYPSVDPGTWPAAIFGDPPEWAAGDDTSGSVTRFRRKLTGSPTYATQSFAYGALAVPTSPTIEALGFRVRASGEVVSGDSDGITMLVSLLSGTDPGDWEYLGARSVTIPDDSTLHDYEDVFVASDFTDYSSTFEAAVAALQAGTAFLLIESRGGPAATGDYIIEVTATSAELLVNPGGVEVPPPDPGTGRLGVYNGTPAETPIEHCEADFGAPPDITSAYLQVGTLPGTSYYEDALAAGIDLNLTRTAKGTQHLAGIAAGTPASVAWMVDWVDWCQALAEAYPARTIYITLDHEAKVKVRRGELTGDSANPTIIGQALAKLYEEVQSRGVANLKTTYWFVGSDRVFEGEVGRSFHAEGFDPDFMVWDPYGSSATATIHSIVAGDKAWLVSQPWYDGQPLALGEFGLPVEHGDAALEAFYTDVRTAVEDEGLAWAIFFNRTKDNNHKITVKRADGSYVYPRAVAAFSGSLQGG